MPRRRFTPLALVLAALSLSPGYADVPAPVPAAMLRPQPSLPGFPALDNAALLYYQAFLQIDRKALDAIRPADAPDDWTPDANGANLLVANSHAIGIIVRASQIDRCDWGVEYAQGWNALLPQLGPFRSLARMLDADTRRLISSRGVAASAEVAPRLTALLRMGDHVSQNPVLINSLVGVAVSSLGVSATEHALNRNALDAPARDAVLAAARSLLTDDPFHMKAAIRAELTIAVASLNALRSAPESPLARSTDAILRESQRTAELDKLDAKAHAANIAQLEAAYPRILDAWDKPDAPEQLKAIADDIDRGKHGLYAAVLAPAVSSARAGQTKATSALKALITRLEQYTPPAAATP